MMASVGVRGLAGVQRQGARREGERAAISAASVQTGYDAETGQPIYEEESSRLSRCCRRSW